jgi:hypothetical protein
MLIMSPKFQYYYTRGNLF